MIKLFSLFSGIGAFEKALTRLKIPFEIVGFSEIDRFAIKSYCAIHNVPESKNYGDITNIDASSLPDFDLLTWRVSLSRYKHCSGGCRGLKKVKQEAGYIMKDIES